MDDVCIDSVASRQKQADLYASLASMGYELEGGWSAIVSIRRAGNSAGTKVRNARGAGAAGAAGAVKRAAGSGRRGRLANGGAALGGGPGRSAARQAAASLAPHYAINHAGYILLEPEWQAFSFKKRGGGIPGPRLRCATAA